MGAELSAMALECACVHSDPDTSLSWDTSRVLAQGSNKSVFSGKLHGESVVVCCSRSSKRGDASRLKNEIETLKALGQHSAIVRMLTFGYSDSKPYLVLERVRPVGFDLDRLWSQYELMGAKVPSHLCGRLFRQLVGGLEHMHGRDILHLDLKAENVLVTSGYNAKICDFGVATKAGSNRQLICGYMSPELCNGLKALSPAADCWGLGLILHQMYQCGEWKLVDCRSRPYALRRGVPCCKHSMPRDVRQVMLGLIKQEPSQRLTLQGVMESEWLSQDAAQFDTPTDDWFGLPRFSSRSPQWSALYQGSSRPLTVSLLIGTGQTHLFDRTLDSLGLNGTSAAGGLCAGGEAIRVLLVQQPGPGGQTIMNPGPLTPVRAGMRIFLGVSGNSAQSDVALHTIRQWMETGVDPCANAEVSPRSIGSCSTSDSAQSECPWSSREDIIMEHGLHKGDNKGKLEVSTYGAMYSFAMEFDCFTFPEHIGEQATVGKVPATAPAGSPQQVALDLKGTFNINLVGIQRAGDTEVEWFPDESALVSPGDLGLVARCPCEDGSSTPSIEADDLGKLMVKGQFQSTLKMKSRSKDADITMVIQSQHPCAIAYEKPGRGAA